MENKVTASVVAKRLGIPRHAVYRLAELGIIPGDAAPPEPWNLTDRRRWTFDEEAAVRAYERFRSERAAELAS